MWFRLSGVMYGSLLSAILSIVAGSSEIKAEQVAAGRMIIVPRSGMVGALTQAANLPQDISVKSIGPVLLAKKDSQSSDPMIQAAQVDEFISSDSPEAQAMKEEICGAFPGYICEFDQEIRIVATTNDPKGALYGMAENGINAQGAWDRITGDSTKVVAIIDTGIDYNHQDLAANVWTNPGEVAGNGIDDDGNGYVDDVHGWNAFNNTGNPMDDNGHGTHVAGTIGAVGNNGIGVVGVNHNIKLMGLKFLNASGSGSLSGAVAAIYYMVAMKNRGVDIRVSNNSWGGGGFSQALYNAISAANDVGIVFVAAAGNESNDNDASPSYPAGYELPNVVSVGAIDSSGNLASFSNYGANTVDLAAPGVGILSTYPGNRYESLSGTSMATPHVAGAFALLFASEPGLSVNQAIERMLGSVRQLSSLTGLVKTGAADIKRAINGETSPIVTPPQDPSCVYEVKNSAEAVPDASMIKSLGVPLIAGADEFSFGSFSVPGYKIDGSTAYEVTVSPNGVLYMGKEADSMDYKPGKAAPLNALAFQSDFVSSVYAYSPSSEVTYFLWESAVYGSAGLSFKGIMALYANGTMAQWILDNNSTSAKNMTMGYTNRANQDFTYARNSAAALGAGTAVKYVPHCGDGTSIPASVDKVKVVDVAGGKEVDDRFAIKVTTSNSSAATKALLQIGFGNKLCSESAEVSLNKEKSRFSGRIPSSLRSFSSLKVIVGGRSSRVGLSRKKVGRRSVSEAAFNNGCSRLFSSIRAR